MPNFVKIAQKVLHQEAEAILHCANLIEESFEQVVETILESRGRLIVTGIGKSAIIAQKIVATMNSTGQPAIFMHAADAIHGDLGMIQDNDVILCLSKSGNTPEIKVLVPLLKRHYNKLIALVSNAESYLAKQADFVLLAAINQEADPLNLAPTTSTTVSLALGDALAICLLEARNFTSQDFAKYHPGGSLGKQLYLKVQDVILPDKCPKVSKEASIEEVIYEISSKRLGATAVVDEKNQLLGIITDGDLRRMLTTHPRWQHLHAVDIMSKNPKTIEPDAYAVLALERMQTANITQLIVLDNEQVLGFVHLHDLLKEGLI